MTQGSQIPLEKIKSPFDLGQIYPEKRFLQEIMKNVETSNVLESFIKYEDQQRSYTFKLNNL